MRHLPRLAFVSPFIDKRHGTERRVAEWLVQLEEAFEVHLYSQRVEDIDLSQVVWHKIPRLPGPHILNYLWWFASNHLWRMWDRRVRGLQFDLVTSPGINCFDADAVSVHIVFAEYLRRNRSALRFHKHPLATWPWLLHRRLYYRLIVFLERLIYSDPRTQLILVARKSAVALNECYGRKDDYSVVYDGIDQFKFSLQRSRGARGNARGELGIGEGQFVLLLIGNDWRNKGLPILLEALDGLRDLPVLLLVVGSDDPLFYRKLADRHRVAGRIIFLALRKNVELLYAAADVYVGPSLEDSFALPPAEAMACGLPVITSVTNGTSEIIEDGVDGLLLRNPTDSNELASLIRKLYENPRLREEMGAKAAEKMLQFTWEKSGREMTNLLLQALEAKKSRHASVLRQET